MERDLRAENKVTDETRKQRLSSICEFHRRQTGGPDFPLTQRRVDKATALVLELVGEQESCQEYDPCPKKSRASVPNHKTGNGHGSSWRFGV
jgi:hypothetical protein